jgi:pimeloyl-ACP methyl ester carboxylesterase
MQLLDLMAAPTAHLDMSDGARLALWDSGGDGPVVFFLHGFPENRLCWRPVLERLEKECGGGRWIAYDLRGFGESSKKGEASWQQMVSDHLEVARLLGVESYHLVGHDWGGAIALHLARLTPQAVKSACILNTTFWKLDYRGMWHVWLMNLPVVPGALFRLTPDWFFSRTMGRAFIDLSRLDEVNADSYRRMFRDRSTTRFWIRLYRNVVRGGLASSLPRTLRNLIPDSRARLPRVSREPFRLPFRIIWGVEDRFCPLWVGRSIEQRLREYGAQVEFIEVDGSGHFVTEEKPGMVARHVADWLKSQGISRGALGP